MPDFRHVEHLAADRCRPDGSPWLAGSVFLGVYARQLQVLRRDCSAQL